MNIDSWDNIALSTRAQTRQDFWTNFW